MANFDLTHTGQDVDDAITAVKNSGANAAAWLAALGYLDVTPGTAELSKAIVLDASKQIDELDITTVLKSNSNFVVEGDTTTRCVLRAILLDLTPGATPGTNINITQATNATFGFNGPTITNATNLAAAGSSGSFSLDAGGTLITMDLTENIIGIINVAVTAHDVNSSSVTEMYVISPKIDSSNIQFRVKKRGNTNNVDWRTILDAADTMSILLAFVTST